MQDKRVNNMTGKEPVGKKYIYVKGDKVANVWPRVRWGLE